MQQTLDLKWCFYFPHISQIDIDQKRKHGLWVEAFSHAWKYVQNMTAMELGQGDINNC
jgi:hypothetical protein